MMHATYTKEALMDLLALRLNLAEVRFLWSEAAFLEWRSRQHMGFLWEEDLLNWVVEWAKVEVESLEMEPMADWLVEKTLILDR